MNQAAAEGAIRKQDEAKTQAVDGAALGARTGKSDSQFRMAGQCITRVATGKDCTHSALGAMGSESGWQANGGGAVANQVDAQGHSDGWNLCRQHAEVAANVARVVSSDGAW